MLENYLGVNIKWLRKQNSVSQEGLGLQLAKGQKTIGNWETSYSEPNIGELLKISNYFGISIDDLLTTDLAKEDAKHQKKGITLADLEARYKMLEKMYLDCQIEKEQLKMGKEKAA